MYEEIIQTLIFSRVIRMIFVGILGCALTISLYLLLKHFTKQKKQVKGKRKHDEKKRQQKEKDERFIVAVLTGVLFAFLICTDLYDCLSLREDMITENYATYVGEFQCYEYRYKTGSKFYVQWENADGKTVGVEYDFSIDEFHEGGKSLEEGYYNGTIVYSPRGDVLLWWDAGRIKNR